MPAPSDGNDCSVYKFSDPILLNKSLSDTNASASARPPATAAIFRNKNLAYYKVNNYLNKIQYLKNKTYYNKMTTCNCVNTWHGSTPCKALHTAISADSQSTTSNCDPDFLNMGVTNLCRLRPSIANLDLSDNHSSLISCNRSLNNFL